MALAELRAHGGILWGIDLEAIADEVEDQEEELEGPTLSGSKSITVSKNDYGEFHDARSALSRKSSEQNTSAVSSTSDWHSVREDDWPEDINGTEEQQERAASFLRFPKVLKPTGHSIHSQLAQAQNWQLLMDEQRSLMAAQNNWGGCSCTKLQKEYADHLHERRQRDLDREASIYHRIASVRERAAAIERGEGKDAAKQKEQHEENEGERLRQEEKDKEKGIEKTEKGKKERQEVEKKEKDRTRGEEKDKDEQKAAETKQEDGAGRETVWRSSPSEPKATSIETGGPSRGVQSDENTVQSKTRSLFGTDHPGSSVAPLETRSIGGGAIRMGGTSSERLPPLFGSQRETPKSNAATWGRDLSEQEKSEEAKRKAAEQAELRAAVAKREKEAKEQADRALRPPVSQAPNVRARSLSQFASPAALSQAARKIDFPPHPTPSMPPSSISAVPSQAAKQIDYPPQPGPQPFSAMPPGISSAAPFQAAKQIDIPPRPGPGPQSFHGMPPGTSSASTFQAARQIDIPPQPGLGPGHFPRMSLGASSGYGFGVAETSSSQPAPGAFPTLPPGVTSAASSQAAKKIDSPLQTPMAKPLQPSSSKPGHIPPEPQNDVKLHEAASAKQFELMNQEHFKTFAHRMGSFGTDEARKKERKMLSKKIKIEITQVSGNKQQVIQKSAKLVELFGSLPESHRYFAYQEFAQAIVSKCDGLIQNLVFPLSEVIMRVVAKEQPLLNAILHHLHKACILTVPKFYSSNRSGGHSKLRNLLMYKEVEEGTTVRMETEDEYIARQSGYIMMYAGITQANGGDSLHGAAEAWKYLSRLLNELPATRLTASALENFLRISGSMLFSRYQNQMVKLLQVVDKRFLKHLASSEDTEVRSIYTRLHTYLTLEKFRDEPEGKRMPDRDASSQLY